MNRLKTQFESRAAASSWLGLLLIAGLVAGLTGCQSMLLVERTQDAPGQQWGGLTEEREVALGARVYQEILTTEPKSQNAHLTQMLERVGQRVADVSERPDFQWEFTLLSGPKQRAFCLPGGKVAVYEGIMPVCVNEAGLAVVLSHEIAHALSRHGGERLAHRMETEEKHRLFGRLLRTDQEHEVAQLKSVYGLNGKPEPALPFSRTQEAEADSIGLLLMARAGYDPREAAHFWERFSDSEGDNPSELLAVHPTDDTRTARLNEIVPRALSVYQSATQRRGLGEQIPMQALAELKPASLPKPVSIAAAKPEVTTTETVAATPSAQPTTPPQAAAIVVAETVAPIVQMAPEAAPAADVVSNEGRPTVEGTLQPPQNPITQVAASTTEKETEGAITTAILEVVVPTTRPAPASPALEETSSWKSHGK